MTGCHNCKFAQKIQMGMGMRYEDSPCAMCKVKENRVPRTVEYNDAVLYDPLPEAGGRYCFTVLAKLFNFALDSRGAGRAVLRACIS